MADSDQNRDNPFSFKKFVNKKDSKEGDDGRDLPDDEIDIFDMPEDVKPRKRDKQKQILVVEDEPPKNKPKKKGKSENPFSFKKFLSGPTEVKPGVRDKNRKLNISEEEQSITPQPGVKSVSKPGSLPDFVQDHYAEMPTAGASNFLPLVSEQITRHSPDIGDTNCIGSLDSAVVDSQPKCDNDFSDDDDEQQRTIEHGSRVNALPDFLSDAAIGGCVYSDSEGGGTKLKTSDENGGLNTEQLQKENTRIRRQIEDLKLKRKEDAERISYLQEQLREQKKKEEEETAVMDSAMEQVEKNLSETTKRAVHAETIVTKLKQELKSLQVEMKALRAENSVLRAGDQYVLDIKERTSYVADQLANATKNADNSLRQMLSGLDNLKLMSQVLNSIDKISEETGSTEQSTGSTTDAT